MNTDTGRSAMWTFYILVLIVTSPRVTRVTGRISHEKRVKAMFGSKSLDHTCHALWESGFTALLSPRRERRVILDRL
jgi:hypothetical protein